MNIIKKVIVFGFIVTLIISISTNAFGVSSIEWPDSEISKDKIIGLENTFPRTMEYLIFFAGIILAFINIVLYNKVKKNNKTILIKLIIIIMVLQFLSFTIYISNKGFSRHIDYVPSLIDYTIPIFPIVLFLLQFVITIVLINSIKKNKNNK